MPFNDFLKMNGVIFDIERNGICIGSETGLPNHEKSTNKAYIGFTIGTDIQVNDLLINPTGDIFYVVEKQTKYVHGEPFCLEAYTITEYEYKAQKEAKNTQPIITINEAHNSIIGTQQNATITNGYSINDLTKLIDNHDSADKELLKEMLSVLEKVASDQKPVKKGLLSNFADTLQRNEWITGPIAAFVLEKFLL